MLCWLTVLALWGTYTLTLLCWGIWLDFLRYVILYLADSLLLNVSYMTEDFLTFNYLGTFWSRRINSWVSVWAQSSSSGLWILKEREVSYFLQSWYFLNVGWINVHFFLDRKETFQSIFLDVSHARIVNEHWELGKNEKSLKYVEHCLQNFVGFGILNSEGNPVSWFMTEQSCEIRMGYTSPKYRGQGHMWEMGGHSVAYFLSKNIPFYIHVSEDKEKTQQMLISFGFKNALCGWHQWKCTPKKYCWWYYCPFHVFLIREKTSVQTKVVVYTSNKNHPVLWGSGPAQAMSIIVLSSFSCILQNIRNLALCCPVFPLWWEMSQSWNYPMSIIRANISHFPLWRRLLSGRNPSFSCFSFESKMSPLNVSSLASFSSSQGVSQRTFQNASASLLLLLGAHKSALGYYTELNYVAISETLVSWLAFYHRDLVNLSCIA